MNITERVPATETKPQVKITLSPEVYDKLVKRFKLSGEDFRTNAASGEQSPLFPRQRVRGVR